MIRSGNRFHGHNVVARLRGDVMHSANLSLRFARSKRSDYRLAVVVSKKVAPLATTRNRIRRRLFEVVRVNRRFDNMSIDVVLYVKSAGIATMSAEKLTDEVLALSRQALARLDKPHSR